MPEVTRQLRVPVDGARAWRAIGDARALGEWLGGEAAIDLRPGGSGRVALPGGDREIAVEEVSEGRRLAFHWWPADANGRTPLERGASTVEIDLDEREGQTTVRVTERTLAPARPDRGEGGAPPEAQASIDGPAVYGVSQTAWALPEVGAQPDGAEALRVFLTLGALLYGRRMLARP